MLAAALLSGCAADGRGPGTADPARGAFELRLEKELRALASAADDEGHVAAQAALLGRIDAAAAGRPALPAPVPRMAGDDAAFEALTAARARLVEALAQGGAGSAPAAAAIALATWDCWAALAALRTSDRLRTAGGALADCRRRHAVAMERLAGAPDAPPAAAGAISGKGPTPMRENR